MEFKDVFQIIGCLPTVCYLKLETDAFPRKVPFTLYEHLSEELDQMYQMNVIGNVTKSP